MIGRKREIEDIQRLLLSKEAEFLAVTGRRRVGKTYLIDTLLEDYMCFKMVGIQNQDPTAQLLNFAVKLSEYDEGTDIIPSENWQWAFIRLKAYLKKLPKDKKQVIFIDELPWVASSDRTFVQMLAHLWNDYLASQPHFILVICGSATSWIVEKIIGDPGGMHNRVTMRMHIEPFSLAETKAFLWERGVKFDHQEIAKVFMALGGIPYYLRYFKPSDTFVTGINRICFRGAGGLRQEYQSLYTALFRNANVHEAIVSLLASKPAGLNRSELKRIAKIKSNSGFDKAIKELTWSGFVAKSYPFGSKKRGAVYQLIDEFSIFYHRFMSQQDTFDSEYWPLVAESQSFKIWLGYAFERLSRRHAEKIKQALGINGVYAPVSTLNIPPENSERGCQIDLLIDRKDNAINLCEMKFHTSPFKVDKDYADKLRHKKWRFEEYTKTKKRVILTMVTNWPVKQNEWFLGSVDATVMLDDLF